MVNIAVMGYGTVGLDGNLDPFINAYLSAPKNSEE